MRPTVALLRDEEAPPSMGGVCSRSIAVRAEHRPWIGYEEPRQEATAGHRGWQLPTAYRVFVALKALWIVNTESTGASAEHPRDHRRATGLHATAGCLAASLTCRHCCMSATRSKLAASALFALTCP